MLYGRLNVPLFYEFNIVFQMDIMIDSRKRREPQINQTMLNNFYMPYPCFN